MFTSIQYNMTHNAYMHTCTSKFSMEQPSVNCFFLEVDLWYLVISMMHTSVHVFVYFNGVLLGSLLDCTKYSWCCILTLLPLLPFILRSHLQCKHFHYFAYRLNDCTYTAFLYEEENYMYLFPVNISYYTCLCLFPPPPLLLLLLSRPSEIFQY